MISVHQLANNQIVLFGGNLVPYCSTITLTPIGWELVLVLSSVGHPAIKHSRLKSDEVLGCMATVLDIYGMSEPYNQPELRAAINNIEQRFSK